MVPRVRRPLWWWFALHGAIVLAWAIAQLATPLMGGPGWTLDVALFGLMLVLAGVELVLQWLDWRHVGAPHDSRWLLVGGITAFAFGVACASVMPVGDPMVSYWVVVAYLLIEGGVFVFGGRRVASYAAWGGYMGGVIYLAAVVLLALRLVLSGVTWDVLDLVLGVLGVLYSVGVIVAALQVRARAIAVSVHRV